ncbi:MAG TPA: hypothetical protein VMT94_09290 [Burkholderiales bacterium]|nr:hypothetical protein [Burkholderiales bacterium]
METVPPECMPGDRALDGLAQYDTALDELLAAAQYTVRIFEYGIGRNYNSTRRWELLRRLLLARRANRIHLVLHDAGNIVRDCPRLIGLLRQFSHNLSIHRVLPTALRVCDPFAIADDARFVRRFHHEDTRGVASIGDIASTRLLIKRFDEIWAASTPAVSATTIGL